MRARGFLHGLGVFLRGKKAVRNRLIENYQSAKDDAVALKSAKEHEIATLKNQIKRLKERKELLLLQMSELQEQIDQADKDEKKLLKIGRKLEKELLDIKNDVEEQEGMVDRLGVIEQTSNEPDGMLSLVKLSTAELHAKVGVSQIAHLMWFKTTDLRDFADSLVAGGINFREFVLDGGYILNLEHRGRYELMTDIAYALELVPTIFDEAEAMQQEIEAPMPEGKRSREDEDDEDHGEEPPSKKQNVGSVAES